MSDVVIQLVEVIVGPIRKRYAVRANGEEAVGHVARDPFNGETPLCSLFLL